MSITTEWRRAAHGGACLALCYVAGPSERVYGTVVNLYGSFRLSFVYDLCATIQSALVRVATDFEH